MSRDAATETCKWGSPEHLQLFMGCASPSLLAKDFSSSSWLQLALRTFRRAPWAWSHPIAWSKSGLFGKCAAEAHALLELPR